MTTKDIMAKQAKDNVKYEVALKIRALLDEAAKAYGKQDWEDDNVEAEISELVFSE
jgi:hypothetical protein